MVAMCWEKKEKRRVQLFGRVKGPLFCTCRESEVVHKVCALCSGQCHRTVSGQTGSGEFMRLLFGE